MTSSSLDFVDVVAADLDLVVTRAGEHACRLEPRRRDDLDWHCDLDDGTPTDEDHDPASFVRWVCPAMRTGRSATGRAQPVLDVRRAGPGTDLGRFLSRLGRLGRPAGRGVEARYVYDDPAEVLDAALRRRIEEWPSAWHGDGMVRPAELWAIRLSSEGLIVESVSWWGSAAALDHHLGLAIDIARRLADQR